MSNQHQPDPAARIIGHLLVGVVVALIAKELVKQAAPAIVIGLLGVLAHEALDAPVSRALGEMGV